MKYENRPLVKKLVEFTEADSFSFHVPGHKSGMLSGLPETLSRALRYDVTELEGLDDLHEPMGVIDEAERRLSALYGAEKSFFLVNGSTVGNLAMVYATCRSGDTVIVQRNAHKSIFNAIELTGAKPVFITPKWDNNTKTTGFITTEQIKRAIETYPEVKAVVLTYPSYYGKISDDLKEIIQLCHLNSIPVLVDEAHGAHFVVGDPFPSSALDMGADVVVHSAHKTLPAMTMASYLHIRSSFVSVEKIVRYLRMLQSSSPSYLLMASLDDARAYAESYTVEDMRFFTKRRKVLVERLRRIPSLRVIEMDDPLKIIIRMPGYSGYDLQKVFEKEGVYAELADINQVLFILPLLKTTYEYKIEEIINRVSKAVNCLNKNSRDYESIEPPELEVDITELSYTASEMESLEVGWIPYESILGKVIAESIIPYPPGIPLLLKGEKVNQAHLDLLNILMKKGSHIQGGIRIKEQQVFVVIDKMEE